PRAKISDASPAPLTARSYAARTVASRGPRPGGSRTLAAYWSIRRASVLRPVYAVCVSHRPLATVCGLTIGDYLLWNWSLNANHAVLALISGLTLPPLAIAFVWLLALTLARLIADTSRDARDARARKATRARTGSRPRTRVPAAPRAASPPAGAAP